MVSSARAAGKGRWLRKYKVFFLFGLVILAFQVLLVARFLELNSQNNTDKVSTQVVNWQPQLNLEAEKIQGSLTSPQQVRNGSKTSGSSANITVLQVDTLDFKPECEINWKEAVSAIHRAKTQKCKQTIATVACRSLNGTLYPKSLTGSCPNGQQEPGKAMGCFKDESNYRLLNGYFGVNKQLNSPEYCMQLCLQSGFMYAGVQYSNECFCGNDEPPITSKLPDSSCNMECPGDPRGTCGGYFTLNIYQTGIEKFVPEIAKVVVNVSGDEPARIVFLLTVNGRALRQVRRLLKILYNERHYYYIHVDVREDYLFRELIPLEKRFSNIRLTRRRFATIWGGASLLEMLLSCMRELLHLGTDDRAPWHWDFVLNLSESDFPVKTVESLTNFLGANRGRNFVKSHGRDTQRFLQKQGLDKTFVECDTRMWRVADRRLPGGLQMDGGSDWIALSRPFVEYVATDMPDNLIVGLKQVFRHTLLPAESFFHTALRNSRFCGTYVDNNLHVTNWKRKLGCKCQYKHVVDWCGCSPNDFRLDDWPRVQATLPRQLYFARKFEPIVSQSVILKLELWLHDLEKPSKTVANLHSYWQSLYHHLDLSPAPPDDGVITVARGSIRVLIEDLNKSINDTNKCDLKISDHKLVEVMSYHHKDMYKYTIARFTNIRNSEMVELAFRPVNVTYQAAPSAPQWAKRMDLIVSSDYDQKEQMSRNFARILTSFSEPVLVYKIAALNTHDTGFSTKNLTCLWIDPNASLVEVTEFSLDENQAFGHSKPSLKQPHLPGLWTVKIIYKNTLIAQVKFLITPLEFFAGDAILSPSKAKLIHGGIKYDDPTRSKQYSKFLKGDNSPTDVSLQRVGSDLRLWIDQLFRQFWVVERVCGGLQCANKINSDCRRTSWSSYAPDPKSAIGEVNRTSGRFDIW